MASVISTGPTYQRTDQGQTNADTINAGIRARALARSQEAIDNANNLTQTDAYKNATPDEQVQLENNAAIKIQRATSEYNSTISADPTTASSLNDLAKERSVAVTTLATLPSDTPDSVRAIAQNSATAAQDRYANAVNSTQNNGGVLPGSANDTSQTGVPVTESPPPGIEPYTSSPPNYTSPALNADPSSNGGSSNAPTEQFGPPVPTASNNNGAGQQTGSGNTTTPTSNNPITDAANGVTGSTQTVNNSDSSNVSSFSNPANDVPLVKVKDQRVRLTPKNMKILGDQNSMLGPLVGTMGFMFPYTPQIGYAGNVNYGTQALTHANQDFKPFSGVPSSTFTINGAFTAQDDEEAKYLVACLHFLRSVTKMRFGQGSGIGLPPPVLVLNGYGIAMFNNLSVIITAFNMDLPSNVDYIKTTLAGNEAWAPAFTNITVTCVVQNTPNKLRTFNWDDFASGALIKKGGWS